MISEERLAEAARLAAGNHLNFTNFAWRDRPENDKDWTIVYTSSRDSRLLEESNAEAIALEMRPFMDEDDPDVEPEHHTHWLCGWVDGYAIRVYKNGEITPAFRKWVEIREKLDNYPILDEEDYSKKEYEATLDNILSAGYSMVKDDSPEDWPQQVYKWFWDNNQVAVENRDDQGGYPSDEEMKEALDNLGFLSEEYYDE